MTTQLWLTRVVFVALAGSLAIASAAEGQEPEIRVERDIVYGKADRVELRLNLAMPGKGSGPHPQPWSAFTAGAGIRVNGRTWMR